MTKSVLAIDHLGYPNQQSLASIQWGIPKAMQTLFIVDLALNNLIEEAIPRIRAILKTMDSVECKLICAQDRLAASALDGLKLRENEPEMLEREYVRWGMRLADEIGAPIYAFSTKYRSVASMGAGNIPVRW